MNKEIKELAEQVVSAVRSVVHPLSDRLNKVERRLAEPDFGAKGKDGEDGKDGENGESIQGPRGMSALDIAIDNGFKGSATEWLESLKGDRGAGIIVGDGPPLNQGKHGDVYIDALTGEMFRCVE